MLALKGFSRVERSLIPTATMARLARQIPNLNAPHQSGLYQASIDVKSYGVGQWRGEPKSGRVLSKSRPEKWARSEEHTSELQSLMRISYAVFCLKKKKQTTKHQLITIQRTNSTNQE